MSKLRTNNGDDHPEASFKHLLDSRALLDNGRPDAAAYHSGYVVECALKSIILLEAFPGHRHDLGGMLRDLRSMAATASGAKTARYLGHTTNAVDTSPLAQWNPTMRYQPERISATDAEAWHRIADAVYQETVARMWLDGEL